METKVFAAINAVQNELCQLGIAKNKQHQQGWKYRGIEDVYETVTPLLTKHKLIIMPRFVKREVTVIAKKDKNCNNVVVFGEFDFISTEDGSKYTTSAFGEWIDQTGSSDKTTGNAQSSCYKQMIVMSFGIPTEPIKELPETKEPEVITFEQLVNKLSEVKTIDELEGWRKLANSNKKNFTADQTKDIINLKQQKLEDLKKSEETR